MLKTYQATAVLVLYSIIGLASACASQVSVEAAQGHDQVSVQDVHVFYAPFSIIYLGPILCRPLVVSKAPEQVGPTPLNFQSQAQLTQFWILLHPKDGSDNPAKRHPGVGRFGTKCLRVRVGGNKPDLIVDEKGIVSNGDRYYKLSSSAFRQVDHLLNDLWYAQYPLAKDFFRRDQLDLTPQQIGE